MPAEYHHAVNVKNYNEERLYQAYPTIHKIDVIQLGGGYGIEILIPPSSGDNIYQTFEVEAVDQEGYLIEPEIMVPIVIRSLEKEDLSEKVSDKTIEIDNPTEVTDQIVEKIKTIYDPEIPVNIYDLGLIYSIQDKDNGEFYVEMTLTSPNCPVAGSLPGEVQQKIQELDSVNKVEIELVWSPPWTPDRMSEEAKLELGFI